MLKDSAFAFFCVCAVFIAAPAGAATPSHLNRQVVIEDARVAQALRMDANAAAVSEATARAVGPLLYADNNLTANESDLILELLGNPVGKIGATGPAGAFQVPPLSAGARAFLELHDTPDLNTLWLQGPRQMKMLVDVTVLNPHVVPQMRQFFGMNLFVSWRASVALKNNRYIRETLTAALNQFRLAGAETERRGRALLYDAMVDVDRANRNAIPDELYAHLKPAPAAPAR
jgi:hypothetical protein